MTYLLMFLIALGAAFANTPAKPPAAKPAKSAKTSTAAVPDGVIEQRIRDKFAKSKVASSNFQVRVQGGIATLEGKASVIQHKGAATRRAKSAGAKAVVNKIQISDEARKKAAANLEKGRRREQQQRGAPVVTRAEVRMN